MPSRSSISLPIPVLLTVRELDQGGVERDVAKIAQYLDRALFDPHVATYFAHGLRYEELKEAGIPIMQMPVRSIFSPKAAQSAFRLRQYIQTHRIQVVHSYDVSGILAVPVARLARVPVVIGSQLSYRSLLDSRTQFLLRAVDPIADAILANCEAIRKYLIESEGLKPDRVEMCYNGVETDVFFPAPAVSKPDVLDKNAITIGSVCALRHEKNLGLLIEAFARVRNAGTGPKMQLLFVGSGVERESLEQRAKDLGILDSTIFIPATRDVATWLRAIDIFVLPSYSEAFSNSLLEALACGCAAIASRVGGSPEMIGDDERGLLFESNNCDDLSSKLSRLVHDSELRKTLGARAAAFAKEKLSIEIAARTTGAIYSKWLQRKVKGFNRDEPSSQ